MRRRLRVGAVPRWVWYLLATVWCLLGAAAAGGLNVLVGLGWSWPITAGMFTISMVLIVGDLARHDFKRIRGSRWQRRS